MLEQLRKANPHIEILPSSDESLAQFGMHLGEGVLPQTLKALAAPSLPEQGNCYVASDARLEQGAEYEALCERFYGGMSVQMGYCIGQNQRLNALEWHKGWEVNLAATPLVLLLAHVNMLRRGRIHSSEVKAYYFEAGEVFAVFGTTLHFSPCKVLPGGFRCGVVLPRGTNEAWKPETAPHFAEDEFLFARNKWLVAHAESVQAKERGAAVGIEGENILIHTID